MDHQLRIIKQASYSKDGNDCMIYDTIVEYSGYFNSCEYWCGSSAPQDDPETWDEDEDEMTDAEFESAVESAAAMSCGREFWEEKRCT